tara:strand:+ start:182 stop:586 length:405 start_codon:yes stop_codon:yes gene_type:complete
MRKPVTASVEMTPKTPRGMPKGETKGPKPKTSVPTAAATMEEDGVLGTVVGVDADELPGGAETDNKGCKKNCEGMEMGNGGGLFGAPVIPTIKQEKSMPLCFCCPNKCKPLALYTLWSSTTAYEVRRSLELCAV